MQTTPPTLQNIVTIFEEWRTNKQKNNIQKAKIPKDLWKQVSELFDHYPLIEIRKALNLNPRQLAYRFKTYCNSKNSTKHTHNQHPTFIPINIKPNVEVESNFIGKVEIKRPNGTTIAIEHVNQTMLSTLLTQFMQGL